MSSTFTPTATGQLRAERNTQFARKCRYLRPGNPLYLTLFRRYSSTQGRWLSPDPAGLGAADPANPQSWNRYAYVLNNPINFVDPLGLACYTGTDGVIHCISTCGAACAGGGGA